MKFLEVLVGHGYGSDQDYYLHRAITSLPQGGIAKQASYPGQAQRGNLWWSAADE